MILAEPLISKTFLFLGFSFSDPNIDYILSRVRTLLGQNQREHYCIMKRLQKPKAKGKARAEYEYQKTKQDLRIADLKRYSIRALMVDDYDEITTILRELKRRSHQRDIFVSGSAHEYGPMQRDSIEKLSRRLGQEIIRRGYNLTSGFGLGIGGAVIVGAMEALYADERNNVDERTRLRPFPQDPPKGMTRAEFWTKYREDMISNAGFTIFLCGNKIDPTSGQAVIASGVLEEFEITKKLEKYPIPIGVTGYAAQQIWEEVISSLDQFYPQGGVKGHFKVLGDSNRTVDEIVDAVFAIVKRAITK